MKIGLITFCDGNYGSTLQCYCTKHYLEKRGAVVDLIKERKPFKERVLFLLEKALFFLKHPFISKKILKEKNKRIITISNKANMKIDLFCQSVLQPKDYSLGDLKRIDAYNRYDYFVCGSDQIWNFYSKIVSSFYTLSFAKKTKKISFAPSFGASSIQRSLYGEIKNKIKGFSKYSVREENGKDLLKEILSVDACVLPDPTFLLLPEEWDDFAKKSLLLENNYIFVHFLNVPNENVIDGLKAVQESTNYKILLFSYFYDCFKSLSNTIFIEGTPYDYVSLIKNANVVFTDSFHTCTFSLRYSKEFYAFERNYCREDQSSRVLTLLNAFDAKERYLCKSDAFKRRPSFLCDQKLLIENKTKLTDFLELCLNLSNREPINQKLKTYNCTSCYVCSAFCSRNAISSKKQGLNIDRPIINNNFCVNCGACQNKCYFDVVRKAYTKEAYLTYNVDLNSRKKAASGGTFLSIAEAFLGKKGVVYGAGLFFKNGTAVCKHIRITEKESLDQIIKSKYVRSDCLSCFPELAKDIESGKEVLFCGVGCQIDALYRYLGNCKYLDNLYTIDLICHGNPSIGFFNDYLHYLNSKYKGEIINFEFRKKSNDLILYVEQITLKTKKGIKNIEIPLERSAYYKMFIDGYSYFDGCYNCSFASLNRVSDITIGDYFEAPIDYPNLVNSIDSQSYNATIINSQKGKHLLECCQSLARHKVDIDRVQLSHKQLCKPMEIPSNLEKLNNVYLKKGYKGIENCFRIPRLFNQLRRIIRK